MSDFDNSNDQRKQWWEERKQRAIQRHGRSHVWTGLFLLLIGAAATIRIALPELPHWWFGWQMLLIAIGIFIGFREKFRGGAWFVLILVGGAFLVSEIIPEISIRQYIWPMILMVVGILFIFRPKGGRCQRMRDEKKNSTGSVEGSSQTDPEYTQDDFVDSTSIFAGSNKIILSKNFKGGELVNVFGGTELNLTQADFAERAELEMTNIFGGTKLIIPSHWSVKSEATVIFGGIDDKRAMPASTTNPSKILVIKGTVIFGGIEIKSF